MAHTPLPWRVEPHDGYIPEWFDNPPVQIVGADDEVVADNVTFYPTAVMPGDAELIVRAVNSYDELLSALSQSQKALAMMISPDCIAQTTVSHAFATATAAEASARSIIARHGDGQ
ncbi:p059 [Rhizobium phage 16-3]|uniref:p059 n=1 Tax=Rhizobium phage 16-3 TaxID=10704 RepID=UPI00017BA60C|nr:p059 [Rhizobium phage 16-3]ABF71312.1 p059 [Rhizobium phage 16-3]